MPNASSIGNSRRVLLSGGGTLGPVTPLLAVAEAWRKADPAVELLWIGTPHGPERGLVTRFGMPFQALAAPKFDRTRPWLWLFLPWQIFSSLLGAWRIIGRTRPDLVMSAGAYVSVPLAICARLRGIPVWVHQLDVVPGLANKLMAPFASKISVTWAESASAFKAKKTVVVGGLARPEVLAGDRSRGIAKFQLDPAKPTVLVLGGGTGARQINEAMLAAAPDILAIANVIHLTGKGKMLPALASLGAGYAAVEFLDADMADAYAAADVVVARAGMGTIAELVALRKPSVIIPIKGTHQEANAAALTSRDAAIVISDPTPQLLSQTIKHLLADGSRREVLADNIGQVFPLNAEQQIVEGCRQILG